MKRTPIMENDTETADNSGKKSIFDDLSRDELINKCKGLLAIAQKAKNAKSELQKETESYKLQLQKCETEKKVIEGSVKTLQELVDSLTEQKLNYITDLDSAQNKIKTLQVKCQNYEEEIDKYKSKLVTHDKNHIEVTKKLSDLDSEIISLKRQNNRLVDENEQLINQLAELEARAADFNTIGLQQREQLQQLEEKVQSDDVYKAKIEELNNVIQELETKLQSHTSTETGDSSDFKRKLKEITLQYEYEKTKNEKAHIKLKSYKEKILKCAACIHQLKNSRFILIKTVKEYSENIPKWQTDIINASKVLDGQINTLNNENRLLQEKYDLLKQQISEGSFNKEMKHENESMKFEIAKLKQKLNEYETNNNMLISDNEMMKQQLSNLNSLEENMTVKNTELDNLRSEIVDLQKQIKDNSAKENILQIENDNLNKKIISLEKQIKISAINNSETDNLKSEITVLQKQLEESAANVLTLKKSNETLKFELTEMQEALNVKTASNCALDTKLAELKSLYSQLKDSKVPKYLSEIQALQTEINDLVKKNNALFEKNRELNKTIDDLENQNNTLQNHIQQNDIIQSLNLQIRALESEKDILVKEKLNARDNILELENQNKILSDQINNVRSEVQMLKTKLETLSQEKLSMEAYTKTEKEEEINNLKSNLTALQEQYDVLKKEHDNLQDLNGLLKEEVETLKLSLEQPHDDAENLSDLNVSLQADIVKLETKLGAYKQENASLLAEMKESRAKVKEFDSLMTEYEEMKSKVTGYKTENAELLNEMKEINQVLKERGESISKLQKAVVEMERLIETLEKDRDNLSQEKEDLSKKVESLKNDLNKTTNKHGEVTEQIIEERNKAVKALAEKEAQIDALQEEIENLKQQQTYSDLPNEDMSTSTTSKAEEHARMKDLDDSFEERYTKLRMFALKLKKKLNNTIAQLANAEQDKARLEQLLIEHEKVEVKPIGNDEVDHRNKVGDGDGIKSDKITELELKVKTLTATVDASEQIALELGKVKAELHSKNQELAHEIEAHKATKEALEKARRDVRKKNVLALEMEDYERSLKELTIKMEESKKKMIQMESTIDTQEGTITAMKTQIKLLEEQIKAEETQNRLTKEELQHTIEESKDKDNVIQMKNDIIIKLEQQLQDELAKNEEAEIEMTTLLSDKEKVIMALGEEKTELNNKLKRIEFKCAELNESLRIANIELADLKTEYTSYKVRAQAVLRQNQTVDHSQEEQLKEETAAMRTQIETLNAKLTTVQEQLSEQSAEVEASRRRVAEAAGEAARAQQRTARLQADLTRLGQQLESERTQHKLQVSTLTQCYKTQISELESKLQKETEALKKQLILAQENIKTVKVGSLDDANHNQYMLPVIPKEDGSDGEMDINVSMIPREEGEGSESAPSPPLSKPYLTSAGSGRSPVPLERLLEEGVPEDEALDTSSLGLTPEQEISDLRRKLTAQQQRVKHVTVLLSESERECARMAQLAELLKSELRRVRGTSANAHNTEYMKNVTLKFLTLPPGDERSRLVPVLQKILTLTNDETHKIQAIAKGQDPNSKGWGSYLPWPGGK